jgi:uncharacterized membrane protein YfcA
VSLQGVEMQDARLSGAVVEHSVFTEPLNDIATVTMSRNGRLVNWLIVVEYLGGATLGGVLGAHLAFSLGAKKKTLTRIFAGIVLVVAVYMLYVTFTALHLIR